MSKVGRKYPELISHLKQVKYDRNLTLADIVELVNNQTNAPIPSERSIQKVFSTNAENETFIYESSIKAIAGVLLDYWENDISSYCKDEKFCEEQIVGYKIIIEEKNKTINSLRNELSLAIEENETLKEELSKVPYLNSEIEQLKAAKEYLKIQIDKAWKIIDNITEITKNIH